jgi:hypothetical protein
MWASPGSPTEEGHVYPGTFDPPMIRIEWTLAGSPRIGCLMLVSLAGALAEPPSEIRTFTPLSPQRKGQICDLLSRSCPGRS